MPQSFSLVRSLAVMACATAGPLLALDGTLANRPIGTTTAPYGYAEYLPPGYNDPANASKQWPVVIYMQGAGERGDGSESSLSAKAYVWGPSRESKNGRDFPFLHFTPQSPNWFVGEPVTVNNFINYLKATYRIDPKRVIVGGLCTGGAGAVVYTRNFPTQVAALFTGVIETASLFQRLVHHQFYEREQCVLVSMSGVPTRACRRFIRRLADAERLPVVVFTDGDPYGYCNIYRTLKVGSGQAAHINRFFCVPQARFLGVTPRDIRDYRLEDATHPLEEADIKRARDALQNDPFIRHHREWQEALKEMLELGVRIDQQAFAKHGLNFVLETYLPEKLKKRDFLP